MGTRQISLLALALGLSAAALVAGAAQIPLRDLCTDKVIGHKDTATGTYVFPEARKTYKKSEVKRVDLPVAKEKRLDHLSVCSQKAASRQFCWFMVEGSVGCSGCGNAVVYEYCWDFQK